MTGGQWLACQRQSKYKLTALKETEETRWELNLYKKHSNQADFINQTSLASLAGKHKIQWIMQMVSKYFMVNNDNKESFQMPSVTLRQSFLSSQHWKVLTNHDATCHINKSFSCSWKQKQILVV